MSKFKSSTNARSSSVAPRASPISSSTSCSCCAEDFSADDSSSLGYGSGHSSTYSDSLEAQIDEFYRNSNSSTPVLRNSRKPRRSTADPFEEDEPEFYDLDSVDNFSLASYEYEDPSSKRGDNGNFGGGGGAQQFRPRSFSVPRMVCCSSEFSAPGCSSSDDLLTDFDSVEPSELLRRSFTTKIRISDGHQSKSSSKNIARIRENPDTVTSPNCPSSTSIALRSIPEDHIYEEVRYDTADLNLEGVRPPPLPKRTYHCHHQSGRRRATSTGGPPPPRRRVKS